MRGSGVEGGHPGVLHFDSKAHVVDYIYEKYPLLGSKVSIL
jgi:hypothetical protein